MYPAIEMWRIELPRISEAGDLLAEPGAEVTKRLAQCSLFLVSTPPFAHEAYASVGLTAGTAVMCEKPVGITEEVAAKLRAISLIRGLGTFVDYQLRFDPVVEFLRQTLDPADISYVELDYRSNARISRAVMPGWYKRAALGGGVKFSLLPHIVDLIHFLGLEFATLRSATARTYIGSKDRAADELKFEAELKGHGIARIHCSAISASDRFTITVMNETHGWLADLRTGKVSTLHVRDPRPTCSFQDQSPIRAELGVWKYAFWRCLGQLTQLGVARTELASMHDAMRVHGVLQNVEDALTQGDSAEGGLMQL